MKSEKVSVYATLTLCAAFVALCFLAGCGKNRDDRQKNLVEVYPAEGHAYMKDPIFKAKLKAQENEQKKILGEREQLFGAFEALEKRAGSRAAAEKLDEWKNLERRAASCADKFEANRTATMELLRERMKQAQADSARIARGEARAKE